VLGHTASGRPITVLVHEDPGQPIRIVTARQTIGAETELTNQQDFDQWVASEQPDAATRQRFPRISQVALRRLQAGDRAKAFDWLNNRFNRHNGNE